MLSSRSAAVVIVAVVLSACGRKVEGPTPGPTKIDPQVVCQDQLSTWVTLTGSGFSPSPVDALAKSPRLSIPKITVTRAADVDGSSVSGTPVVLDPDATSTASTRVKWTSEEQMSFLVDPALELERGLYRLRVDNATGASGTLAKAFTAVPPPVLESAVPQPVCTAQFKNTITLSGDWFLQIGSAQPTIEVGTVSLPPDTMTGCSPVDTPRGDVERCTTMTVTLDVDAVGPGAQPVVVTNPAPANCLSTDPVTLTVVPPPSVTSIDPQPICDAQGDRALTVTGTGFLQIGQSLPKVTVGGIDAQVSSATGCTAVSTVDGLGTCTGLDVTVASGSVDPGSQPIVVTNPDPAACHSIETVNLAVVPAPTLAQVSPEPVCDAQGDTAVTLTGTGFIQVGSAVPSVTVGSASATSVAVTQSSCTPVPGTTDSVSCTEVTATVPEGSVGPGLSPVVLTNPDPAGCATTETVDLSVVPPPTVTSVAPNPVCLAQGDASVTVTGTGFLWTSTAMPSVTVGTVAATSVSVDPSTCSLVAGTQSTNACTSLTAVLGQASLADGASYPVVVTNPEPAACHSDGSATLQVTPPPSVTGISPAAICTGGGVFDVTGSNLAGVFATLVDTQGGVVNASSVTVNDAGDQATVAFGAGLKPETYQLHVQGAAGCSDVLATPVTVSLGPTVFYVDPPVAYNGVPLRITLYVSNVSEAPGSVEIAPAGGGTSTALTDVTWSSQNPNVVQADLPAGIGAGSYDVYVRGVGGCDAFLANGLTVKGQSQLTIALATPAMVPAFGLQQTNVPLSIEAMATSSLGAGQVNFEATPRVYLSSAALGVAEPLTAVAFESPSRLSAVVPPLPAGTYDLVVVNPDGSVGFRAAAYRATTVAPPQVSSVDPSRISSSAGQTVTVSGANFTSPSVTLTCSDGSTPAASLGAATGTQLDLTIDGSGVANGAACVVTVTDTQNSTFASWSAVSVTNPAGKLAAFAQGGSLVTARRADAAVVGQATPAARFLYAIGGDAGDPSSAMTSVEAAPLDQFGVPGAFRTLQTRLPGPSTEATAVAEGRFVYLVGGMDASAVPTAAILAAEILDPLAAPSMTNVDLAFAQSGSGLVQGSWTYEVAAVLPASDPDNPGGETLASAPITVYAPAVPGGVQITLSWSTVTGSASDAASAYRIYRAPVANGSLADLRLLAEVPAEASGTQSFTDDATRSMADGNKQPLEVGALGVWHGAGVSLTTSRAAFGFVEENQSGCAHRWYVVGGATDSATESDTYEVATISGGVPGAFTRYTASTSTGAIGARRELSAWAADPSNSSASSLAACGFYLYVGPGAAGASGSVSDVQVATYTDASGSDGELGLFSGAMNAHAPVSYQGYAAFWSGDFAYALGGKRGSTATNAVTDAQFCSGGTCTEPTLDQWSNASNSLLQARYLAGFARDGAFAYLVGGADGTGAPLATTELNVR